MQTHCHTRPTALRDQAWARAQLQWWCMCVVLVRGADLTICAQYARAKRAQYAPVTPCGLHGRRQARMAPRCAQIAGACLPTLKRIQKATHSFHGIVCNDVAVNNSEAEMLQVSGHGAFATGNAPSEAYDPHRRVLCSSVALV